MSGSQGNKSVELSDESAESDLNQGGGQSIWTLTAPSSLGHQNMNICNITYNLYTAESQTQSGRVVPGLI
jgi:hypothetical protein